MNYLWWLVFLLFLADCCLVAYWLFTDWSTLTPRVIGFVVLLVNAWGVIEINKEYKNMRYK